ncbi:hypothetical protein L873DRAFT_1786862 [Choiromyces venosus 120613-1]|uniref:Uncharacterized protein n=1 Tax=Choiromyces venosus 120613-1 TaxID=1336337 RepID=A0A3N4K1L1_9PEZI|nr:hypothetical protein L873DRAFT_1786862 [Choiromyces venosus 120613-1]
MFSSDKPMNGFRSTKVEACCRLSSSICGTCTCCPGSNGTLYEHNKTVPKAANPAKNSYGTASFPVLTFYLYTSYHYPSPGSSTTLLTAFNLFLDRASPEKPDDYWVTAYPLRDSSDDTVYPFYFLFKNFTYLFLCTSMSYYNYRPPSLKVVEGTKS